MRFECSRAEIARAILVPSNLTPSRATHPGLLGTHIEVTATSGGVQASDGDLWARATFRPSTVQRPGALTLPTAILDTIVRSTEDSNLSFEAQGRYCEIRGQDAVYNVVAVEPANFALAQHEQKPKITISRAEFDSMYQRTSFSVGKDVGRYAVNGLMVEIEDQILSFIATDSRRMARASRKASLLEDDGSLKKAIIPPKAIQEVLRGGNDDQIALGFDSEFVTLVCGDLQVVSRLIVGDFPDHRRIIPQGLKNRFSVSRDALLSAVRRAAVFSADAIRAVHLDVTDKTLTLSSESDGRGRASTKMPAEISGCDQVTVDLNPDFLIDFLKVVDTGIVHVEFRDSQSAIVLRHETGNDIYLVMPITSN